MSSKNFSVDAEVSNAWNRLTSDTSPVSWVICGYDATSSNELKFKSEGSGGMPEFVSSLPADDVAWGAFKVVGVDDRGNTVSRRPKFVFVKCFPAEVPTMRRARAAGHKGAIKQIMNGHIDVEVEIPSDITEDSIIQKLRQCGGAHQPTSYEFSNYSG